MNVYLLPYIGATYQGYANLGGNQAVIGVWTDKASRAEKPPVKAPWNRRRPWASVGVSSHTCLVVGRAVVVSAVEVEAEVGGGRAAGRRRALGSGS